MLAKALGITDGTGDTNLEGLYNSLTLTREGEGGVAAPASDVGATAAGEGVEMGMGGGASAHEAGHDAFMTGVVFASLLERAAAVAKGGQEGQDAAAAAKAPARTGPPSLTHAEPWINKIFMRMSDIETFELRNFKQVRLGGGRSRVGSANPYSSAHDHAQSYTIQSASGQIPDRSRVFHVRTQLAPDGTPTGQLQHRELRDAFASLGPLQVGGPPGPADGPFVLEPELNDTTSFINPADPCAGQARGLRRLPQHGGAPARGGDAQVGTSKKDVVIG